MLRRFFAASADITLIICGMLMLAISLAASSSPATPITVFRSSVRKPAILAERVAAALAAPFPLLPLSAAPLRDLPLAGTARPRSRHSLMKRASFSKSDSWARLMELHSARMETICLWVVEMDD